MCDSSFTLVPAPPFPDDGGTAHAALVYILPGRSRTYASVKEVSKGVVEEMVSSRSKLRQCNREGPRGRYIWIRGFILANPLFFWGFMTLVCPAVYATQRWLQASNPAFPFSWKTPCNIWYVFQSATNSAKPTRDDAPHSRGSGIERWAIHRDAAHVQYLRARAIPTEIA